MRFDVSARVEVWVTTDEIMSDHRYGPILESGKSEDAVIADLKQLATDLASENLSRLSRGTGVEITVDSLSMADVNPDRVDWVELSKTTEERQAE